MIPMRFQPNTTGADLVGQTPWSARVPLDPLPSPYLFSPPSE